MAATVSALIRILLVEGHTLIRTGLRMLLECRPGLEIVGEAAGYADAIRSAAREQPDIILLDPDLGNGHSLDLIPQLLEVASNARVIVITGQHDDELHRRAVRFGAKGLVLKDQTADMLIKAVEKVYIGEVWLDRSMMASILSEFAQVGRGREPHPEEARIASLTEREHEVIALICEGLQNKAIGHRLSISEPTVRHHLTSIFDKLGVTNRLELVIYAYRHGLVKHHL